MDPKAELNYFYRTRGHALLPLHPLLLPVWHPHQSHARAEIQAASQSSSLKHKFTTVLLQMDKGSLRGKKFAIVLGISIWFSNQRKVFLLRQPLPEPSHKSCDNKLSQRNATTKCHYKLSLQLVTTDQSKISSISDTLIYFACSKWCKMYMKCCLSCSDQSFWTLLSLFCSP